MKNSIILIVFILSLVCLPSAAQERIEEWRDKTVMVFTPHPDDDLFGCGGTLARMARNGNRIITVIYTNDNKGSFDLEMTSERLARIRKAEAVTKHVSQFEPSINKYRPDWDPREKAKLKEYLKGRATKKDGRYVEAFRRATGFNQQ
ncbi:MAG: PIG-L family deacetylase [Acidobacteriota bacterium]|nr:MAG: PIG-L family deacetylase [Acidobacteriota bacterium]